MTAIKEKIGKKSSLRKTKSKLQEKAEELRLQNQIAQVDSNLDATQHEDDDVFQDSQEREEEEKLQRGEKTIEQLQMAQNERNLLREPYGCSRY